MKRGYSALVVALMLAASLVALFVRRPNPFDEATLRAPVITPNVQRPVEPRFARWAEEYVTLDLETKTPIRLAFSRAFSAHFTRAFGKAEIDFRAAKVHIELNGLEELEAGAHYEVWLVDHVERPGNTAAIELGEGGDRILNLGELPLTGSMAFQVDEDVLSGFRVDQAGVMQVGPDRRPEYVVGGMQSIRFQIGREALEKRRLASAPRVEETRGLPITLVAKPGGTTPGDPNRGRTLFLTATFGGNGRTCATCHPLTLPGVDNGGTIDAHVIQMISLAAPNDPLFVSESNPNLPPFDPANPLKPALEFPAIMHARGLILENIDGFGVDRRTGLLTNPPFFRAVPGILNLDLTAPYGLSGNVGDLQTFSTDAVTQHFPKTLARKTSGKIPDFVLPTAQQLKDLEAFMLSAPELRSPADGNFFLGPGIDSVLSNTDDPDASLPTRAEVRGRDNFLSVGCTACHTNAVFADGNFNTNVELAEKNNLSLVTISPALRTPTTDTGFRNGKFFQAPQLFGLRKRQFFHSGVLGNQLDPVTGEFSLFLSIRQAIEFYLGDEFRINDQPLSDQFRTADLADPGFFDDIAHFLVAISVP